jgi:hypothetical protein
VEVLERSGQEWLYSNTEIWRWGEEA